MRNLGTVVALSWMIGAPAAWADDPAPNDYLNLSFTGDGATPSAMEVFGQQARKLAPARAASSVSDKGDVSYALPLPLPPALHAPSVALSYSSQGGSHSFVARGWSIDAGMQITRVTGAAASHAYAEYAEVYRVGGGGLSGLVVPFGTGWKYVSTGPIAASVSRGVDGAWTVVAAAVTTRLEADDTFPWDVATQPTLWHTTSSRDASGNTIAYSWTGDRLDSILYGGATDGAGVEVAGEEHLIEVSFDYGPRAHASYQAQDGHLAVIEDQLQSVVIASRYGLVDFESQAVVALAYEEIDQESMLVEVDQVSVDGLDTRLLAAFDYAALPDLESATTVTDLDLPQGSYVTNGSRAVGSPSWSDTSTGLFDLSGDGLAEVLEAGASWIGRWYLWEGDDATWDAGRTLDMPGDTPCGFDGGAGCDYDGESFERTYTVRCGDDHAKTLSARRVLDVDGDGHLDVVQIAADAPIPSSYYPGASGYPAAAPLCDSLSSASLSETEAYPWTVWFGNADGFADEAVLVDAPVDVPRMSISPVTKERASATVPSTDEVETTFVDLLDMDADGWVDVVHLTDDGTTPDAELVVYFHEGWRGGGWSATGVAVTADTLLSGALGSLESTEQDVVTGEYQIPDADWQQVSAQVDAVHVVRALRDVNGDGLLDFVDASGWSVVDPTWDVWLGTGRRDGAGFEAALPWAAPIRDLSLTDEGSPAALTCSVPTEAIGEGSDWTDGLAGPPAIMAGVESGGGITVEMPMMSCGFADGIPGSMAWNDHGRPQKQTVGLLDMDGDGRADLVDLQEHLDHPSGRWWRNVGDGFSTSTHDAPSWFRGALSASATRQIVAVDSDYLVGAPLVPAEEGPVYPSSGFRVQLWSVFDVDRDGLPDLYDAVDEGADVDTAGITYAPRPEAGASGTARPGLLIAVTGTHGARTELAYASSARMSPSGEDETHQMSAHHDVVAATTVADPVSGNAARLDYQWSDGVSEGGQFLGFARQEVRNAVHDADVHGQQIFQHLSTTKAEFLLDRDYVLPTTTEIHLNAVNPSVTPAPGGAIDRLDQRILRNYATVGFTDGLGTTIATSWLAAQVVTDYPEKAADAERSSTVSFTRDGHGHATEIEQSVADCAPAPASLGGLPAGAGAYSCAVHHQDDQKVEIAYVHDAASSHFVPSSITTSGWDTATASWEPVERGEFFYDGGAFGATITSGLLSRQDVRVDPATSAGALTWSFTRDARGAVTQVDAPGGRLRVLSPAFGHALTGEEENGEGHVVSHTFDALGRQTQTTDANLLNTRTSFDALGRPSGTWVTPVGGVEYRTSTTTHDDTWGAAYVATKRSTYSVAGGAPLICHERQVLDGFGDPIQTWRPAEAIGSWIVEETIRDVQGNVVRTSYPHRETTFSTDFAYTRDPRFASWSALDAYGRPHETWADYDAGLGAAVISYPGPGWTITTDAVGYQNVRHTDTHGRLVAVYEGLGASRNQTATWIYDARSRVTGFLDANANAYAYDYDGLGRLREVTRESATGGVEDWYAYEYEGPDPVEMWEGGFGATLAATWTYDTIGRPLEKELLNCDTGLYDSFTWSWDAQWKGARDTITDPSGQTDYTYEAGAFGSFGHPTNVTRTWVTSELASFDTAYDFEGHPIAVTWPTGAVVESTYSATGWLTAQDVAWSGGTAHVAATYDDFGLPSGWTGGEAGVPGGLFVSTITRTSPTQLAETAWTMPDGSARELAYPWADNGLLTRKSITRTGGGPPPSAMHLDYGYDEWKRLESITNPGGLLEGYTYDPLGNLTELQHGPRTYTYTAGPFSEVAGRLSDLGEHTTHAWDAQGRMTSWDVVGGTADTHNTYAYDGAGRLVRVERDEPGLPHVTTTYGYDVDDQLVYETRGTDSVLRFNGYRSEGAAEVEKLLPMVSREDGALRWTQTEPDGHAIATYASTGAEISTSVLGGYGLPIAESGAAWKIDGFHGGEPDGGNQVAHMGARHMLVRDGTWMQPEPLLYLGPTNGDLGRPLGYGGVYAAGNPIALHDRSGRTTLELAGFGAGAVAAWETLGAGAATLLAATPPGAVVVAVAVVGVGVCGMSTNCSAGAGAVYDYVTGSGDQTTTDLQVSMSETAGAGDPAAGDAADDEAVGPALPDEAWGKDAPRQVEPGTKSIVHDKEGEKSVVEYDEYGRQKERTDYTDHGRPKDHTDPHHHSTEYGVGKGDGHTSGPKPGPAPGHPTESP